MIKVGELVNFKADIEGEGIVVDVIQDYLGPTTYVVGAYPKPSWDNWHPEAREGYPNHDGLVVYVDEDHIRLME